MHRDSGRGRNGGLTAGNGAGEGIRTLDTQHGKLQAADCKQLPEQAVTATPAGPVPESVPSKPDTATECLRDGVSSPPLPTDLAHVVDAWADLPEPTRAAIRALVDSATEEE